MADATSPPQPLPATPEILGKVLERRPVLWVGGGLSIAAGYPSERALVEAMARASEDPLDTSLPFFKAADAFVASMGRSMLVEILRRELRPERRPTAAHRALARLAGAGRFCAIVTTNHDRLIERALEEEGVPHQVLPADAAVDAGDVGLKLLKLEGSFEEWVKISGSGQADAEAGRGYPFLRDQVEALLREESVLFVGAGLRDPRLLGWLGALSEEEVADLKPWRALMRRENWEGIEGEARDTLVRARVRPLLLDSNAELPGVLAELADKLAPAAPAGPGMRLRELALKDFRGFADFKLAFPEEPLAVLVGVNGAGKSSVLEAIGLLLHELARDVTESRSEPYSDRDLGPVARDIREGAGRARLQAAIDLDGEQLRFQLDLLRYVTLGSAASPPAGQGAAGSWPTFLGGTNFYGEKNGRVRERLAITKDAGIPVLCYYATSRAVARESAQRQAPPNMLPQLYAYQGAFDRRLGPFQDFVRWFRLEEDLENETRVRGEPAPSMPLEIVRAAVERFMSVLPGGRFSNLHAERVPASEIPFAAHETASLVIDKAGQRLALEQLSDGERTLLLLVADIARRLAIANPGRPDPLSGTGIVLIDEIELHLHPSWQRAVLPGLRRAFPGIHFIVATHSPQVLSQVPAESVILLEGFQAAGAARPTYGRDSNAILEEVLGVPARPREMAARLKEVGRLIDEERLEEARGALDEVAAILGPTDGEIVRLRSLIEFLSD